MKNILIIGSGGMGKRHIRAFLNTGRAKLSCYDIDSSKLELVEKEVHGPKCYYDLSKIPVAELDGVVIATPPDTHLGYMYWCVENGLSFLVEKPISVNIDGLSDIIENYEEVKQVIAETEYARFLDDY